MGLIFLLLSGYLFNKRIRKETAKEQLMIWSAVFTFFGMSLFINWYFRVVYHWDYGVPGSDLQNYFRAARALKEGDSISDLANINYAFDTSITHIGYIVYILFISLTVFSPVIISIDVSLQILYCIQILVGITTVLNISDFFNDHENIRVRNRLFWMLSLCASIWQMSSILMRDIWILWFISVLMNECKKANGSLTKCIAISFTCFTFRSYSIAITVPIILAYKYKRKKIAALISLGVFAAFFVGQGLIDSIAHSVGIRYAYTYHFTPYMITSFLLSPSPLSQAYNVQHMNYGFHANFGGNTEWIYYLLSCWNVFVFPVCIYGIYRGIKDGEGEDVFLWGMIILNIAMLICLFYGAVSSPRQKLLIVISLAYLFKKGYEAIKPLIKVIYSFIVIFVLIGIFAVA